jgi:beta-glucanase (GH16 family)
MRNVFYLLLPALLDSCVATRPLSPAEIPEGYQLAWHDEFNTDGPPDTTAWSHETGFSRNRELQWYQPANATCRRGLLVITARREDTPNPRYQPGSPSWKTNRPIATYTSSCIKTAGKKQFLYGRFEIRARLPVAPGSWPAIWMLGDTMPWPSNGEIDIMEYYPIRGIPHLLANTAWGTDTAAVARWNTVTVPLSRYTDADPDWTNKFHVWRADWDENAIRLYLDDELLNETLLSTTINGAIGHHANPFHQPHYILLNLAIGSTGGEPDPLAFPITYEVDYVRVFQKKTDRPR